MKHPEELLADYADGTLSQKERAAVDAHLGTCETCREELALASRAVTALSSLPQEPVPHGLASRVIAEASRPSRRAERTPWTARLQWAAGLAAAAALVTVVALNLPDVGGNSRSTAPVADAVHSSGAESTLKGAAAGLVGVEVQNVNYDEAKVAQLASSAAPGATMTAAGPPYGASLQTSSEVFACVSKGAGDGLSANDSLARLIDASFHGTPAYLGVFLESPGAGQPPAKVVVWIVAKSDCSILSYASKRITT